MSPTDMAHISAMMKIYPMGEDAMDLRFQVLTKTIVEMLDQVVYAQYKAAGGKPRKPKARALSKFELFQRFPQKKQTGFASMNQSQIAKAMNAMGKGMAGHGRDRRT